VCDWAKPGSRKGKFNRVGPVGGLARVAWLTGWMPDRIALTGLRVRGFHGVYPEERRDGQDFLVDVILELDLSAAARSDDVADTVHYGELADALAAVIAGPPVDLLETLATALAQVCLSDPRVEAVEVTVHKPQAPIAHSFSDVSVTLRRVAPTLPTTRVRPLGLA
jgi:dihydroneopterin aldolase